MTARLLPGVPIINLRTVSPVTPLHSQTEAAKLDPEGILGEGSIADDAEEAP